MSKQKEPTAIDLQASTQRMQCGGMEVGGGGRAGTATIDNERQRSSPREVGSPRNFVALSRLGSAAIMQVMISNHDSPLRSLEDCRRAMATHAGGSQSVTSSDHNIYDPETGEALGTHDEVLDLLVSTEHSIDVRRVRVADRFSCRRSGRRLIHILCIPFLFQSPRRNSSKSKHSMNSCANTRAAIALAMTLALSNCSASCCSIASRIGSTRFQCTRSTRSYG